MTLAQLNYFLAVYQHRNMTKAAEACYVSQPSVSNAIRDLEAELHTLLFWRNKGLEPTTAGEKLASLAAPLLKQFESLPEKLHNYLHQVPPCIKLGIETVVGEFFDDRFIDLCQKNPSFIEKVDFCDADYLQRCVHDETMDFALITSVGPFENPRFYVHNVYCGSICLYTHKDNPLAGCVLVSSEQLTDIPLVGFSEHALSQEEYQKLLVQMLGNLFPYNIVCYSTNLSTVFRIIQKKIASAILLEGLFTNASDVWAVPIASEKKIYFSLIWKIGRVLTGEDVLFIKTVEGLFALSGEMTAINRPPEIPIKAFVR